MSTARLNEVVGEMGLVTGGRTPLYVNNQVLTVPSAAQPTAQVTVLKGNGSVDKFLAKRYQFLKQKY